MNVLEQMLSFIPLYFVGHLEHTTPSVSESTSQSVSTDSPWHIGADSMYRRDKYARDRVMKSARLLLPFTKDTDTILDVGCFTWEARKYFPRSVNYIGIDQKAYHKKTKVVDLNHGFEPIACQHALCLETLEHLIDPADTLESLCKSLSDSGKLVVSLPNETTLFHRIRCLFGTVDAGCFSSEGKHLHLPNLEVSKKFLSRFFDIERQLYYISPSATGSQQEWVGRILELIPNSVHQFLADRFPSFFARGFIFLLKKKPIPDNNHTQLPEQSQPS